MLTAASPAELAEFVAVPLHAEPSSAPAEIDALADVYTDVINKLATDVSGTGEPSTPPGAARWAGTRLRGCGTSQQPSSGGCIPWETSHTHPSRCHPAVSGQGGGMQLPGGPSVLGAFPTHSADSQVGLAALRDFGQPLLPRNGHAARTWLRPC